MKKPPNTNVLQGLACPNPDCNSTGPFRIQAEALFEVRDDGASEFTELDWGDVSFMSCVACGDESTVDHFRVLNPLPSGIVRVDADGAVNVYAETGPRLPEPEMELMLLSPVQPVSAEDIPLLPDTHRAFVRRPDPDVNRQATVSINERVNREFGGRFLRGPVLLVPRGLLPPCDSDRRSPP